MGTMTRHEGPDFKRISQIMKDLGNASVKTGWFANSAYPDKNGTRVALVASAQENGVPSLGIPARPFMGPTALRENENWQQLLFTRVERVLDGSLTTRQALQQFALRVEADISKSIDLVESPELAESTVKARARKRRQTVEQVSKKPLIDSGLMQSTIQSEVTP